MSAVPETGKTGRDGVECAAPAVGARRALSFSANTISSWHFCLRRAASILSGLSSAAFMYISAALMACFSAFWPLDLAARVSSACPTISGVSLHSLSLDMVFGNENRMAVRKDLTHLRLLLHVASNQDCERWLVLVNTYYFQGPPWWLTRNRRQRIGELPGMAGQKCPSWYLSEYG